MRKQLIVLFVACILSFYAGSVYTKSTLEKKYKTFFSERSEESLKILRESLEYIKKQEQEAEEREKQSKKGTGI